MNKLIKFLLCFFFYLNSFSSINSHESYPLFSSNKEKQKLNLLIEKYILENPEIIIEAIEIFQKKQQSNAIFEETKVIEKYYSEIFDDKNSYFTGNKKGDINIVEFIDYNCGYCKKNHDIIINTLKNDKNIKYIVKELPILGESSLLASKVAISIYLIDGPEIYEKFFNLLMNHNSRLNFEILKSFALEAGTKIKNFKNQIDSKNVNNILLKNLSIADKLSINGTPTFIIGKSIIRGFISFEQLQEIIENVRKKQY